MSEQDHLRPSPQDTEGARDRAATAGQGAATSTASAGTAASAGPTLCLAGCGFFGNPAFENYCSVCVKKHVSAFSPPPLPKHSSLSHEDEEEESVATVDVTEGVSASISSDSLKAANLSSPLKLESESLPSVNLSGKKRSSSEMLSGSSEDQTESSEVVTKLKNRCTSCSKKLKLAMSFECRCGGVFCSSHRYFDSHNCSFDHRSSAKAKLEKNNPVVKGAKLARI
jgi:predicted nucleic acid binding AN1-type Zn finger protein